MEAKAERSGTAGRPKVVVVGAGIVGLTVATMLRETLPEVPLTLWAKDFPPNTTSNIGNAPTPICTAPPSRLLIYCYLLLFAHLNYLLLLIDY
jgi:glycine/D-amino acid oxidase-like deaminating enzyme